MATQELTFKINFDPAVATAEMRKFTSSVEASLRQVGLTEKQQAQAAQALQRQRSSAIISQLRQEEREAARTANAKLREEARALRQRIAEENRAAREVARITAETARQAIAQERIRERAAKQLADVQIREAKRAARELEASLKSQSSIGGGSTALLGVAGRIPGLSSLTSELSALTSATQSAGAAQGSLAGPIAIATAAAAAQIGVMFKLHQGLFNLARSTAEFQGNLFDMSQQVGVSVETLSTLEVLATTTGGNIQTVAGALAIFQKNLEASHDPTSKESKLLAELGVTSSDTEEALAQTLQGLFKLGEGSRQTAAVLELFGRSGRFVNAILKETEGDLERAKAKFSELGIVISTEDARAADQFNDSLALLQFQLRGLTAQVGNEVIPVITGALQGLQKVLKDNKDGVEAVGFAAKTTAGVLTVPFFNAISAVDALVKTHRGEIELLKNAYESLSAVMQAVTGKVPRVSENLIPPVDLGGEKSGITLLRELQQLFKQSGGRGFDNKIFKLDDLSKLEGLFKKEGVADPGVALLRQLQSELRRLTTDTKAAEIAEQLLGEQYKDTNESLKEQIRIAARLIDTQRAKAQVDQLAIQLAEEQRRETDAARESLSQFLRQQGETLRQLRFGDKTALQQAEEFIAMFPKWTGAMKETEKFSESFWLRFNAHLIDSIRRMKEMLALMAETADVVPGPNEGRKVQVLSPEDLASLGVPPPPDFSPTFDAIAALKGAYLDLSFSIGQGTASMIEQWVLLGSAGPHAIRKMTAQVLAGLAAQAAAKAIFELAEGFAALAGFMPGPAALHFKAAAFYGATAAAAGLAGRAIAGNTFKQDSGSGAGGGGGAGSSGPQQLNPLTFNRNQPQTTRTIVVRFEAAQDKISQAFTAVVLDDIKSAGPIRQAFADDGVF